MADSYPNSNIIKVVCSENGVIETVSGNLRSLRLTDPGFFKGKKIADFVETPGISSLLKISLQVASSGEAANFFVTLSSEISPDISFAADLSFSKDNGYTCFLMPMSGKIVNEDSFRQMEVMRTTMDAIDDIVFVLDSNGLFTEFYNYHNKLNPNVFASTFKVGKTPHEAGFPFDVSELLLQTITKAKREGKTKQLKFSIYAFGGKIHYSANISPRYTMTNTYDGVTVVLRDITTSVKSEEKLKKSLEYYLTVLDNFPNPIWKCNAFQKLDYINRTWIEFTGIEAERQIKEGLQLVIHENDKNAVTEAFEKKFKNRKPFTLEYRMLHMSGEYRWVKNFCEPLFDFEGRFSGYVGSCFDIEDIRSTQELLQESESRYRAMVQDQSDLVVRWNSDLTISFCNRSFCSLFGHSSDVLVGHKFPELFGQENREIVMSKITSFIERGRTGFFETELSDANGEKIFIQWLNSPIYDNNDHIIEYQSVGRDITEKIEQDKENLNLLLRLNEKVKELSLLNKISAYINEGVNEGILFRNLVNDIAKSFINPGNTFVIIEYDGVAYKSNNFELPEKGSQMAFEFGMGKKGDIKVYRDENISKILDEEFIEESEKLLLKTVCEMVSSYLLKLDTDKKLLQSELRYGELFESVLDIVFSVEPSGRILKINSAASKILGIESFEKKNLWEFAAPSERKEILEIITKVIDQKQSSFTFETKVLSENGNMVYLQTGGIVKYDKVGEPLEIFGIARDVTEQKRIEQSIMKTVISTEEKERKRFAEDLHDGIGPLLSGLKMYLQQDTISKDMSEKQIKILKYCRELVDDAISQTRSIANNITPSVLNDFGLEKALISHVAKINAIGKFFIDMKLKTDLNGVESEISLAVFRVVSELINNALKHAECSRIDISIDIKKNILSLFYADNGKGFDLDAKRSTGSTIKMGIGSIHNRINSLNGSVTMQSNPGEGLTVKIFLPIRN